MALVPSPRENSASMVSKLRIVQRVRNLIIRTWHWCWCFSAAVFPVVSCGRPALCLDPPQVFAPAEIAVLCISRDQELVSDGFDAMFLRKALGPFTDEDVGRDPAERQRLAARIENLLGQRYRVFDS